MEEMNDIFRGGELLPVIEEFYSLQGEGFNTGRAAYFIRVGGCDICCSWCDSKISWSPDSGNLVKIEDIVNRIVSCPAKAVVVTGGEPLTYNLDPLCEKLAEFGITSFLETSGSFPLSGEWDWICLSAKKHYPPQPEIFGLANELKIVVCSQDDFLWAKECAEKVNEECHLFLQPEWSCHKMVTPLIVDFIKQNPAWRISLQSHKFMRIP
jgi:7-carboxy-7-deazaguanine synthase